MPMAASMPGAGLPCEWYQLSTPARRTGGPMHPNAYSPSPPADFLQAASWGKV